MTTYKEFIGRWTLALATASLLSASLAAPALAKPGYDRMDRGMERMAEKLDLSEDQKGELHDLMDAHRDQMGSIEWRTEEGERNPEARQQAREARQALNEEIAEILDAEQAEKFEAMQNQRGHRRGGRHHGRAMGRQLRGLDLSDEQREQIKTAMRETRESEGATRSDMRDAIHDILTEEQIEQLQAMNDKGKHRRGGRGNYQRKSRDND